MAFNLTTAMTELASALGDFPATITVGSATYPATLWDCRSDLVKRRVEFLKSYYQTATVSKNSYPALVVGSQITINSVSWRVLSIDETEIAINYHLAKVK